MDDVEDLKARVAKLEKVISEQRRISDLDIQEAAGQKARQLDLPQDPPCQLGDRPRYHLGMLATKGNRTHYHAPDQKLPMLLTK